MVEMPFSWARMSIFFRFVKAVLLGTEESWDIFDVSWCSTSGVTPRSWHELACMLSTLRAETTAGRWCPFPAWNMTLSTRRPEVVSGHQENTRSEDRDE